MHRIPHISEYLTFAVAINNTKHLRARTAIPQYPSYCTDTPLHTLVIVVSVLVDVVNMPVEI